MTHLPYVAVTMGDAAGIGPEVIIPAVLDREVRERCRPVVIGDARRLQDAARIVGLSPTIEIIEKPADASGDDNTLSVIDLDNVDPFLPWGELSAAAGEAAYQYVARAAEYAVAHEVQAICTAPLNKAALHAAGHPYPGHTEMLAALTNTDEVSMMLSTPALKVIHVTTHVGLIDAVGLVEPGLVHRTIVRGHEALVRAGVEHPRIGVCGINPHAGENGLFGHGEEAEKIAPGVERAVADGVDVEGPLAADTLFYRAVRGDFDLVVAMYHDQGHGPVKVLGIESGVNITVGLPVIRTSVDHGTAFDIAGTGRADSASMRTALLQAAEMADRSTVGAR
ncbi:4-hydroxythreonine-4-phosphate dehydrogenase [Luteimicrobium album]|uniref:4-hydroxythreonine-4-phosphate dehydrogenase n=1 Tax=Luteimicrobium album TaxID=1054550 RepID=A0ABQ6I0H3_9MICO|nr:4-hydroxythreonine-4-phosphate dehydrogenase PdxA [Luteimicrobium album]GMA24186.1 4-hydroxythreonine-4-phosphate dehydrogenase [Luteimicrobium album]